MAYTIISIINAMEDSALLAVMQEVCVLAVFAASFVVWRKINRAGKSIRTSSTLMRISGGDESLSPCKSHLSAQRTSNISAKLGGTHQHSRRSADQVKAVEQQMTRLLESHEFTKALNMYRLLEREGSDQYLISEHLYSAFIQASVRVGKVDVVERMLRAIKRKKMQPTTRFWQTTLRMLSSRKLFNDCLVVHVLFGQQLPVDKVISSCLINAALETGDHQRAAMMLPLYRKANLTANDHVLFFRTFVALDDVESAEAEFRLLGKDMSTLMMNLLLLTCVNSKQPDRALNLLREAHLLEEGLDDKITDIVSYNTVLRGFSKSDKGRRCMECFHEMRAHAIHPDDITYNVVLEVCSADCVVPFADVIEFVIGTSDMVLCNAFIKVLVRNRQLQKAQDLLTELHRVGSSPGLPVYTMMIKALIDQQELDAAMSMVKTLREAGHEPDDMVLTLLLEGCHQAGNHVLGKMVFTELVESGVKPSGFALITMVKMLGRFGEHEDAHELVSTWAAKFDSEPSVIHYTCLMSGCLRKKNYDQAWRAYELMCDSGIQLDDTLLATLLPGMSAAQRWDRCLSLVETAVRGPKRVTIAQEMLNATLSQMLACEGPGELTTKLQDLMTEAGVPCTLCRSR